MSGRRLPLCDLALAGSILLAVGGFASANEELLTLPDAGFEEEAVQWSFGADGGMSSVSPEAARAGKLGLRVVDESSAAGSNVFSPKIPVTPGTGLRLSFQSRLISGGGIGVYLRFYDQSGRQIPAKDSVDIPSGRKEWKAFSLETLIPAEATAADVWIHSYDKSQVVADFDDFALRRFTVEVEPPWLPAYKLSPDDAGRLTEADVPGPDGIVYPDWRMAGVPGGIPNVDVVVGADFFEGLEGADIAERLKEGIARVVENGGGAIEIPPGEFFLDSPIIIRDSHVVIRGAGRDRTALTFRGQVPYGTVRLFNWSDTGSEIGLGGVVDFQANPRDLSGIRVESEGKLIGEVERADNVKAWGNRFALRVPGEKLLALLGPGEHEVRVTASYGNGDVFSDTLSISLSADPVPALSPGQDGIVNFVGPGREGPEIRLELDGVRGSRRLELKAGHGFAVGDFLQIEAPETERWNQIVGNRSPSTRFRVGQYEVATVEGNAITLTQPLRIEFPVIDGSIVQKIRMVERSGIESLTLRQEASPRDPDAEKIPGVNWYPTDDLWMSGVTSCYALACWARDVRVESACRNPIYFTRSKFCEVQDCEAAEALFKGGGGTGYVGFERSFDCLMDGVVTSGMRHAPNVQWGAAGNVIRNGKFIGSDGQWHAGWTNENLFEGNVISSTAEDRVNGTYGFGLFASGPDSPMHGPQGPRNVVYNNDISSPKDGLHMRGGNEAWIIAYNRFRIADGRAIYGKEKSFDHVIRDNVFVIDKVIEPAVYFEAANCTGIELTGNTFQGPVKSVVGFRGGLGRLARDEDNQVAPAGDPAPRPQPSVPSIFEWQRSLADTNAAPVQPSAPSWWERFQNFLFPKT